MWVHLKMWKLGSIIETEDGWCEGLTVVSGPDTPLSLPLLIERHGESLMGKRNLARYGDMFPLRIKIDNSGKDAFVDVENVSPDGLPVTSNILDTDSEIIRDYSEFDTFSLIVCKSGNAMISCNGASEHLERGEILLIPASARGIKIEPSCKTQLLESYIR